MSWWRKKPKDKDLVFLKAVFKALQRAIPYMDDPKLVPGLDILKEVYFSVRSCIKRGGGDCDDITLAMLDAAIKWGYEAYVIEGKTSPDMKHWACLIKLMSGSYVFCQKVGVMEYSEYKKRYMRYPKILMPTELQTKRSKYSATD